MKIKSINRSKIIFKFSVNDVIEIFYRCLDNANIGLYSMCSLIELLTLSYNRSTIAKASYTIEDLHLRCNGINLNFHEQMQQIK